MTEKIRIGMIGGGRDSLIGEVHRKAQRLYNEYELVCGSFSHDLKKSLELNKELGLNESRIYASYDEMFSKESSLPEKERMQVVCIATPNYLHFPIAKAALEHGFHVMLEKPATLDYASALTLRELANKAGKFCCVNYTYAGFPMVKLAREKIKQGELGNIRKVYVEYHQGWLSQYIEANNTHGKWREDPKQGGISGSIADIGTHAFHLAEYITGAKVKQLSSDLNVLVPERLLDDDGAAFLRFDNGTSGVLTVCQAALGDGNDINIRVYGDKGSLKWSFDKQNELKMSLIDKPQIRIQAGLDDYANCEGATEAIANHYHQFAQAIRTNVPQDFPTLDDGVRGMAFIETSVASNQATDKKWFDMPDLPSLNLSLLSLFANKKVEQNEKININPTEKISLCRGQKSHK